MRPYDLVLRFFDTAFDGRDGRVHSSRVRYGAGSSRLTLRRRDQQLLFGDDGAGPVIICQFILVFEHNRAGRAGLFTKAAKDTAQEINLITRRVAFAR